MQKHILWKRIQGPWSFSWPRSMVIKYWFLCITLCFIWFKGQSAFYITHVRRVLYITHARKVFYITHARKAFYTTHARSVKIFLTKSLIHGDLHGTGWISQLSYVPYLYIKKRLDIFCELLHVKFVYKHSSQQNSSFSSPGSCAFILLFFNYQLFVINQIKIKQVIHFANYENPSSTRPSLLRRVWSMLLTESHHSQLLYCIRLWARPRGFFFLSCLATLGVFPHTLPTRARFLWTLPILMNWCFSLWYLQLQRLPVKSPSILVHIYLFPV